MSLPVIHMREAIVKMGTRLGVEHLALPYLLSGDSAPKAYLAALQDMGLIVEYPPTKESKIVAHWRRNGVVYGLFWESGDPALVKILIE